MSRKNYLYPATQSAFTVVQTLKKRLTELSVNIVTDAEVLSLKKDGSFFARTTQGDFTADKVIFALGSEAGVSDKSAYRGYEILEELGHSCYAPLPSLCGLSGQEGFENLWAGVRTEASITYQGVTEEGEIQLTKDGISGIPVFQLSHPIVSALREKKVLVSLDFLPNYDADALKEFLMNGRNSSDTFLSVLSLWLPKKLCSALLFRENSLLKTKLCDATEGEISSVVRLIKEFPYRITGHEDLLHAQVVNGGLSTDEVYDTMESKLMKGLYFAGEVLDVDGKCGGYNLHFAFATGRIAGEECVK